MATGSGVEVPNTRKPVIDGPPNCSLPLQQTEATTPAIASNTVSLEVVYAVTGKGLEHRQKTLRNGAIGIFVPSCTEEGEFANTVYGL